MAGLANSDVPLSDLCVLGVSGWGRFRQNTSAAPNLAK